MLMFYWYQSSTRIFSSEYLGKVLLARDTLLTGGRVDRSSELLLSTRLLQSRRLWRSHRR